LRELTFECADPVLEVKARQYRDAHGIEIAGVRDRVHQLVYIVGGLFDFGGVAWD